MDFDRDILEFVIRGIIKSNLVGFGLSSIELDSITDNMSEDIILAIERGGDE